MLPEDNSSDYTDWSDRELAEELKYLDEQTARYQATLVNARKKLNHYMECRENILDSIKQRAGKKGWTK